MRNVFIKTELTKYELEFIRLCKENNIKIWKDIDGCPIVRHKSLKLRSSLYLCPWGIELFAIVLTYHHVAKKKTIIKRLQEKNIPFDLSINGDTEGIFVINNEYLKKTARTIGFRIKKELTIEQKEALRNRLQKGREANKNIILTEGDTK